MSLKEKLDKNNVKLLKEKAMEERATEIDVLRAALITTLEKLDSYDKRIEAMEKAIRDSNKQLTINIRKEFKDSVQELLDPVREQSSEAASIFKEEILAYIAVKEEAEKKREKDNYKELVQVFAVIVVGFTIAGYIANWLYGWWYDIPQSVQMIYDFFNPRFGR